MWDTEFQFQAVLDIWSLFMIWLSKSQYFADLRVRMRVIKYKEIIKRFSYYIKNNWITENINLSKKCYH